MILADLHTHTRYSHGSDTPAAMHAAAVARGLTLLGFSEHSPRPAGFDYTHEYREQLTRHLPDYVREVQELKTANAHGPCRVLFGMGNGLAGRTGRLYPTRLRGLQLRLPAGQRPFCGALGL